MSDIKRDQPVCTLCGSTDIAVKLNVGFDIDPSGEERQHLDTCNTCGADRLWCERLVDYTNYQIWEGTFSKRFSGSLS